MMSAKLREYLDKAGVAYTAHPHRPAYTSQEIAQTVHVPGREMVKSVVLKADEGKTVLAVLSAIDAVNLDALREAIGCRKLRLATEPEFRDVFPGCKPGAMPPFGNIFNLTTYCESALARNHEIEFNAGSHDETIRIRFADYQRLAQPAMIHFAQPYRSGLQRLSA
jgi:Ala-tRNA(Pro) deacylase